jgi:membrane protein insertase Oxa1/YidC/SpoIIIJ
MISLPSGLVLYIWVNTLVSILQQDYINKKLDKQEASITNNKKVKA